MIIELKTNDYNKLKFIIGESKGISVEFSSEGYSAYQGLSHHDEYWIKKFIDELEAVINTGEGRATLSDERGDGVNFGLNRMGHVRVTGKLSYYANEELKLEFAFNTDQTVLRPLLSDLKKLT